MKIPNSKFPRPYGQGQILNKGFTLIEILVAAALFSTIVATVSSLFVWGVKIQRRSLAKQELLDQTSYLMEYMSRALRMAKKDLSGNCIAIRTNYANAPGNNYSLRFLKEESGADICQEFYLASGVNRLMERKSSDNSAGNLGAAAPLTSANLRVNYFLIGSGGAYTRGWSQTDNVQPRVVFFLDISGRENANIKIQTTVSQRDLDVQY